MKTYDKITAIAGILLVLFALLYYSVTLVWGPMNWLLMVVGIFAGGYGLFKFIKTGEKRKSERALKYGSNVMAQLLIVLFIISMVAFVSTRRHGRIDLTTDNLYSLSDQTEKILSGLKKPVVIKAFFKSSEQNKVKDLLDEYQYFSREIQFEMIDPDEQPQITKQYGITEYNTVMLESGLKRELVHELSEPNLTNAIIKVTREQDKVIYFLTGHGERSINDDTPEGYKLSADAIKKENHLVRELNLVRNRVIPDSCTILAVISPKTDFFPGELDSIGQYVESGGKLLVMLDPDHKDDISGFLKKYHIDVGNNMVIDASGVGRLFGAGPGMPLVTDYDQNNPVTKGFNIMTFYPYASSVTPMDDRGDYSVISLLKTGENSWAETDYASGEVSYDEGRDMTGPVTIAALAEKNVSSGKISVAVFGDSDFAKNGYIKNQGNANLFLNTINYLAEEEDMISIRPKEPGDSRLTLTQADVSLLFYLIVIAIPLLVIIMGVVIYFKRNRR